MTAGTLTAPAAPAATRAVIEAVNVTKTFGDQVALDGIDLTVPEGSIVGPHRPERVRQVDARARAHRHHSADRRCR